VNTNILSHWTTLHRVCNYNRGNLTQCGEVWCRNILFQSLKLVISQSDVKIKTCFIFAKVVSVCSLTISLSVRSCTRTRVDSAW
jgi:hypothetical protein